MWGFNRVRGFPQHLAVRGSGSAVRAQSRATEDATSALDPAEQLSRSSSGMPWALVFNAWGCDC